jgi:hypothetical protein
MANSADSSADNNDRGNPDIVIQQEKIQKQPISDGLDSNKSHPTASDTDPNKARLKLVDPNSVIKIQKPGERFLLESTTCEVGWFAMDTTSPAGPGYTTYNMKIAGDPNSVKAFENTVRELFRQHGVSEFTVYLEGKRLRWRPRIGSS